jgi:DNA-binding winged helix-turn-helix (wHTH) protein/dipeptidyl aminopeptidase/acylaminoacyl peptidase
MASVDLHFGPFCISPPTRMLLRRGQPVPLTPKAFDMLLFLIERRERVVSKSELLSALWPDAAVEEANLSQQVFVLRRALVDPDQPEAEHIATVARIGYRFVSPVRYVEQTGVFDARPADCRVRRLEFIPTWWAGVTAVVLVASTLSAVVSALAVRSCGAAPVVQSDLLLPDGQRFWRLFRGGPALSPDGTIVVYAANRQLYARKLNERHPDAVPGTDLDAASPFFSPDGMWIGFWSGSDSSFKKVRVGGGPAVTIAQSSNPRGAGWFGEYIVFAEGDQGIVAAPAAGGPTELWVVAASDEVLSAPQALPAEEAVLFTASKVTGNATTSSDVVVYSRATRKRKILIPNAQAARYLPVHAIAFTQAGKLLVASFDPQRLTLDSEPKLIAEGLDERQGQFDVSPSGTVIYVPDRSERRPADRVVELVDTHGKLSPIGLPPAAYEEVQISPDGSHVALTTGDDDGTIWICDAVRPSSRTHFAHGRHPIWAPDSQRIAYSSVANGVNGIFAKTVDGVDAPERITTAASGFEHWTGSWSPVEHRIAFTNVKAGIKDVITILRLDDRRAEHIIAVRGSNQMDPAFSPDGQWIAYGSEGESGESVLQLYVEPFPPTGAKYRLTQDGGEMPVWSRDGSRLYYRVPNFEGLMSAAVDLNPFPHVIERVGIPVDGLAVGTTYAVSPGRDILVVIDRVSASRRRTSDSIALITTLFSRDATGRMSLDGALR